jgi:hypothetical protein
MTARTSRRSLSGAGVSMLLLTAAAVGQVKADDLDGELLRRCAEFQASQIRLYAIEDEENPNPKAQGMTDWGPRDPGPIGGRA